MNTLFYIMIPVFCVNFIFIWMRAELSKLGKSFPIFNGSFKVYAEFQEVASKNSNLKKKYNTVLITSLILGVLGILFILFLDLYIIN